jgi:hypothetical protein
MACIDMEEMYRDQGGQHTNLPGFQFSAFYTPEGIRRIDARFVKRIEAFKDGKSFTEYSYNYSNCRYNGGIPEKEVEQVWTDTHESLKKDIEENPHLHPKIKENLLFNLNME